MFESIDRAAHSASLMDGWIPMAVYALTAVLLIRAVGWRSRRWTLKALPALVVLGVVLAAMAHWSLNSLGLASEPAPWHLWSWIAVTGLAVGTLAAGWRGDRWSRRNVCALAASLCLLSTGLTINGWIGYFPTVYTAWNQLTDGPLPDETDWAGVHARQRATTASERGAVLRVDIDSRASGFVHRTELVYLPPVWFTSSPPPRLPTVMMIGGQFNTPADWIRAGDAVTSLDAYARDHDGNAPVAVFVDSSGSFTNDTECVNGPRGNAADHLTKDVVPTMIEKFGVSAHPADWAVVGFSTGGTCAVDLAVMHPELFGVFVDIAGDLGPNTGTREQTVERLYGGDAEAWSRFDPITVMTRHGEYTNTSGRFVVPTPGSTATADALCKVAASRGITCEVVTRPGRHVWPFGSAAFAATLPWLAGELSRPEPPPSTSGPSSAP